ncbi:cephalosporin hydroxylase [Bradyrhizobium sp. USDA 4524]|uniref:CmcI family methyltransferase n=1 Tax=unclassified Bradyrhizobium TaxID=2631580 RepID=UPI0020A06657|nr:MULTISPECIES: CmcI family methyltransferase [unclassified Bradyrhizobium]MCP1838483.1 cephalosporin hydroxylase [Bradyrhizobium sp. USDA 4538]MCP1899047.1 cephalosporin hydroxylase [Bradyrhizobium sp. USDA 4537]MCP1986840.1 cephalosporin hydroxylase [Bradyrhizobium sp. USDA 4539]
MKLAYGYKALWEVAQKNYPGQTGVAGLLDQRGMFDAMSSVVNADYSDRFAKPTARAWRCSIDPWSFQHSATVRGALAQTYKGLVNIKNPFDLSLYTRLIWEIQPRTILELGSFQGGSGLWFADQMSMLCEKPGEVHSFDLHTTRIHANAKHPLLTFHQIDLSDAEAFDKSLLMRLPHPWLVIDDAHVQVFSIFSYLSGVLVSGDYYVIEDIVSLLNKEAFDGLQMIEQAGFLVDTYYTDAFGTNVTCAPNAWFRKS